MLEKIKIEYEKLGLFYGEEKTAAKVYSNNMSSGISGRD